jgi:tetratricopeptide (TPR) repeat protein
MMAFSPDGKILATGAGGNEWTVKLWESGTWRHMRTLTDQSAAAFSPDGKTLATGGFHGSVTLWDLDSGQAIRAPLRGHADGVNGLAFSPDGLTLASVSWDHTLRLWDVASGREMRTLEASNQLWCVAFSPDGKTFATGDASGELQLWGAEALPQKMTGRPSSKLGQKDEAIADFSKVIELYPKLATAWNNRGQAYFDLAQWEKAIADFSKAIELDPEKEIFCLNLAAAYWSAKQLDKSIPLLEETLKRQEAKLGRDHPDTLMVVAILGANYKDAGRFSEAIQLFEEAHRAAKKYSALRWVGTPLLDAYGKAGENAKLAKLLPEQLREARQVLPKDSPQLAGMLAQIGHVLLEQKKWTEAEPLLRECLAIREKTQPDVWSTFNTKSLLGGALLGQKKYAVAEPLLLVGYEGMNQREKTIPEQGKIRLPEALDRLIEFYTASNKPDDVKKWQAERAKYSQKDTPKSGEKK